MVDTIGVLVIEDTNLASSGGAVTGAPCLLSSIEFFDDIRPNEVKNGLFLIHEDGSAEDALFIVLVELLSFRILPAIGPKPLIRFQQFAASEFHGKADKIKDIAALDRFDFRMEGEVRDGEIIEHKTGVELVKIDLWNTRIGEAVANFGMGKD